eukprot:GABV01008599.1.p1 GENE.GABV01008599.1~~GABV01008599.1.p1  ORF type:complete len:103 (-),score=15.49 GABV01008599.1:849-1157(-)
MYKASPTDGWDRQVTVVGNSAPARDHLVRPNACVVGGADLKTKYQMRANVARETTTRLSMSAVGWFRKLVSLRWEKLSTSSRSLGPSRHDLYAHRTLPSIAG